MDETPPVTDAATNPKKKSNAARWSAAAGVLIGIVLLIRGATALFGHASLEACDDSTIQTTLATLVDKQLADNKQPMKFAKLSGIKTVKADASTNSCSGRLDLTDGTGAPIYYNITASEVVIDHVGD